MDNIIFIVIVLGYLFCLAIVAGLYNLWKESEYNSGRLEKENQHLREINIRHQRELLGVRYGALIRRRQGGEKWNE
jgi:hypothetical protein